MKLIGGSAHSFKICYLTPGPKSYDQLEFKYPSERENQWREKKKTKTKNTGEPDLSQEFQEKIQLLFYFLKKMGSSYCSAAG